MAVMMAFKAASGMHSRRRCAERRAQQVRQARDLRPDASQQRSVRAQFKSRDTHATSGIRGGAYVVSKEDVQRFHRDGYVRLRGVMTDAELASTIDPVYSEFLKGTIHVPGRDVCDMSGSVGRDPTDFSIYNVMLPRKYYPAWQGNLFESRCKAIVQQLCGGGMAIDYDQILAKRPMSDDAVFAWHQDMAYWPDLGTDTTTATCWLAVSNSTDVNGCMRFLPGSHKGRTVRLHHRVAQSRLDSHVLMTDVNETQDDVVRVPLNRGDITVHNEYVVHGSGPNLSHGWRNGYVLAFRRAETVKRERELGFTHSHNDTVSWDAFHTHSYEGSVE